jgi:L-lysine 6-transaminase
MKVMELKPLEKLQKYMLVDGYNIIFDMEKSTTFYIHDKLTGEKYLDLFTFYASAPLGCNNPKMTTPEFKKQLAQVAINKPSSSDSYTQEMVDFVDTFGRVAMKNDFKHLFLISGGALAVENVLKAAFDWKIRKNLAKGANKEIGKQIIHLKHAFHGRSGYTLSLTNTHDPRKTMYFPKFDWPRVTAPIITFPLEDHLEEVKQLEEQSLDEINKAIATSGKDIAALILEPIQGEGGDNYFRKEYFQELRKICDENEIMLVYDEVQSGMGLTGKMWAYEHYVKPDLLAFGKKAQVCGTMATKRIDEVEKNVFRESSRINSTWGGNLVDMFRSTRYLQIIEEENLVKNAETVGEYLLTGLKDLCEDTDLISNVRGKGLMVALDLPTTKQRDELKKQLYKNKVLILGCGQKSIRFRPALCFDEEHVDEALCCLETSCKEIS